MNPFKRIRAWMVAEVPPELAACEFHCQVDVCSHGRWEKCPNRLERARLEREARGDVKTDSGDGSAS